MTPLLAELAPPPEITGWVGVLVMGYVSKWALDKLFKGPEKAAAAAEAERKASEAKTEADRKAVDAEWRAEMRGDLKRLLDGQSALGNTQALQAKDIATVQTQVAQFEKRQDAQAEAHREAIRSLRSEFEARLTQR